MNTYTKKNGEDKYFNDVALTAIDKVGIIEIDRNIMLAYLSMILHSKRTTYSSTAKRGCVARGFSTHWTFWKLNVRNLLPHTRHTMNFPELISTIL